MSDISHYVKQHNKTLTDFLWEMTTGRNVTEKRLTRKDIEKVKKKISHLNKI